jgi:hypothetical protein
LGWTREQAIADLERSGIRVWIDGVEQSLMHTDYKDAQHPTAGHVVYRQDGFIPQLPVGDHVSYYEETYDWNLLFTATVRLHILPRTDPSCS